MASTAKRLRHWLGIRRQGDDLVDLINVACEDQAMREQLISILAQDQFNRESMLGTWVRELRFESAPEPLIRALDALLDKEVAEKSLQILQQREAR